MFLVRRSPTDVLWLAFSGCGMAGMCENRVRERLTAPGGAHAAVVFDRSCGATAGQSTLRAGR